MTDFSIVDFMDVVHDVIQDHHIKKFIAPPKRFTRFPMPVYELSVYLSPETPDDDIYALMSMLKMRTGETVYFEAAINHISVHAQVSAGDK